MRALGSRTPVLVLSFRNCEIYCCHLDGYRTNTRALLDRLARIEAVFVGKPASARFRLWFNVDENRLDSRTRREIAEGVTRLQGRIYKLALVGLRGRKKWSFERGLKRALAGKSVPRAYFTDAEAAKEWLV